MSLKISFLEVLLLKLLFSSRFDLQISYPTNPAQNKAGVRGSFVTEKMFKLQERAVSYLTGGVGSAVE